MQRSSICPRGYQSALKYYYPFPTEESMKYAFRVCDGEDSDWTGKKEPSPSHTFYIRPKMVKNINGFTRKHAEQWVNVCTGKPCLQGKRCVPRNNIDTSTGTSTESKVRTIKKMSKDEINELCRNYRPDYPDAEELYDRMLRIGLKPTEQISHDGKVIGLKDDEGGFHVSQPSEPLRTNLQIIQLS